MARRWTSSICKTFASFRWGRGRPSFGFRRSCSRRSSGTRTMAALFWRLCSRATSSNRSRPAERRDDSGWCLLGACGRCDRCRHRARCGAGGELWVVILSPCGTAALERRWGEAGLQGEECFKEESVVVNRGYGRAFIGFERDAGEGYVLSTAGSLPLAPDYWTHVERRREV